MKDNTSVLVIAAHPDDETYGVGGTILRHVTSGCEVQVLILTDGVTARHEAKQQQREAAENACDVLGVSDVHFADLPDQRLDEGPLLNVISPIEDIISEYNPDLVYTHHHGDANQDHRAVFEATVVAVRPSPASSVQRVFSYPVASSTEWAPSSDSWSFRPNVYRNISDTLERKLGAVEAYRETFESEVKPFPHPRSPEAVRVYAKKRGIEVGVRAAEAFSLVREIS
jgi:LmbE family N-acetylglucosaminyl deacetylase